MMIITTTITTTTYLSRMTASVLEKKTAINAGPAVKN